MALFLHFLNREVYRAVNANYSIRNAIRALRVLAVSRNDPLYSNFSNLLEGKLLGRNSLASRMLRAHHLVVAGERPSLTEFLESRAVLYNFDSARYPMYFSSFSAPQDVVPSVILRTGTTSYLEDEINKITTEKRPLSQYPLLPTDRKLLTESLPALHSIVATREHKAITRSLFSERLGGIQRESAAARLISTLYIARYKEELSCDIPTGVEDLAAFDHLANDQFIGNVRVLSRILWHLGFREELDLSHDKSDELFVTLRGSVYHSALADEISTLCSILRELSPTADSAGAQACVQQHLYSNPIVCRVLSKNPDIYAGAFANLRFLTANLKRRDREFAACYEKVTAMTPTAHVVLLVTATRTETQALFEVAEKYTAQEPIFLPKNRYTSADLGYIRGAHIYHVQTEPGSIGPASSQAVITDAISDYQPKTIILAGIAFGARRGEQELGDILVSKAIVEYERSKVTPSGSIPRGQRIESSPKLLSLFRAASSARISDRVHFGVLLTGEKLIDSLPFLQALLREEPEAIGGEMEGAGLIAAAQRSGNTDWIVVKAIVDWAHKKRRNNSSNHQHSAALSAFEFIFSTLEKIGL